MLKNLTPAALRCKDCDKCPSIHEDTASGDFVVVGKKTDEANRAQLAPTIATDEDTVTLPRELLLRWAASLDPKLLEQYREQADGYLFVAMPHG